MFSRIELELELVEWTQWYVLTSLSWLDETLYARVRKPFRCCDWLSQFSKRNFSWGKLWENLSMYIINWVFDKFSLQCSQKNGLEKRVRRCDVVRTRRMFCQSKYAWKTEWLVTVAKKRGFPSNRVSVGQASLSWIVKKNESHDHG